MLTVLTGVAGSGKSSLAAELVAQHEAVVVDQRPVAGNRRSTPITYTGIAAPIRRLFASRHGVEAGMFSANSRGGCPACEGLGVLRTDLAFMDGQETECESCQARLRAQVPRCAWTAQHRRRQSQPPEASTLQWPQCGRGRISSH